MSGISTIRINKTDGEGWQTVKLLRSNYVGGVLVDNGQRAMWVKMDQVHPGDVEYLVTAKNSSEMSVLKTAKMGLISGGITSMALVALLWCWFFILMTTVEEMEHLMLVDIFVMMVSIFIISITLLSGSLGGIIGGYLGYPSRHRGSVIGGVVLTITFIIGGVLFILFF